MSVSDCEVCKNLLNAAGEAMKLHLEASAAVSHAVRTDDACAGSELQRLVIERRSEKEAAVERYKIHLTSHAFDVRTAAASALE